VAWGWGRGGEGGQLVQLQLQVSHASSQPRRLQLAAPLPTVALGSESMWTGAC
jgi:hypothetical protein